MTLREDYRVYDMRKMKSWGHNAFWMTLGETACIFGRTPRVGDVLVSDSESGLGLAFIIASVRTRTDPGDQHFVDVVRWGRPDDLPESRRIPHRGEDWVS